MTIDIEVSVSARQWVIAQHGAPVVKCQKGDFFTEKLKYLLSLAPRKPCVRTIDPARKITLEYPYMRIGGTQSHVRRDINNMYRTHLDPTREAIISREIMKQFRYVFHNFMLGYVLAYGMSDGAQKEGIWLFFDVYNLALCDIDYEMLKKSWNRSPEKKRLKCQIQPASRPFSSTL